MRTFPVILRELTVLRVSDPSPAMRRVTLGGEQLRPFHRDGLDLPGFVSDGFDDHVKILLPPPGRTEPELPVQHRTGIDWPHSHTRVNRDYTPRRWDPRAGELDLDFVLHGDGPAARWARTAAPGDRLHLVGPKSSLDLPSDVDFVLLAGDETALPAIGRFLDERPLDCPVRVVVEITHDGADAYPLDTSGDVEVTWLRRPSTVADYVTGMPWPYEKPYVWCGGEATSLKPLRRWCTYTRELPRERVNITGYWRTSRNDTLRLLLDPLPGHAVRAAVRTGLIQAVAAKPRSVADLAAETGCPEQGLGLLARYLGTIGLLEVTGDVVGLAPLGEDLLDDERLLHGLETDADSALVKLPEAVRAGGPAGPAVDSPDRLRSLVFLAGGITDSPAWRPGEAVRITGPGAGLVREAVGDTVRLAEPAGTTVCALALGGLPDDDAVALLRSFAGTRVLLVEHAEDDEPGGRAELSHALRHWAATGAPPRKPSDLTVLAERAGYTVTSVRHLGWDHLLVELTSR
ncbi:siderophore-interacting protein [Amycolatopsis suaedae]|uniref:Siderophore-interacting protein n=1 Tax=Amycolatopsis suaedae TaxID=2510978 RepID=A0A4Q7J6S9_9PSEU|nr:siderophore-interacting protein [Amycolatopsis suaedae]RZQ63351.1 siderophore-interacting protein [Amycolatopsis suaedae]